MKPKFETLEDFVGLTVKKLFFANYGDLVPAEIKGDREAVQNHKLYYVSGFVTVYDNGVMSVCYGGSSSGHDIMYLTVIIDNEIVGHFGE